jgi:hypothetical protein
VPETLPWMFGSWREYRDYLLEHLITEEDKRLLFRRQFAQLDDAYLPELRDKITKAEIASILVNDYHGTKLGNFRTSLQRTQRLSYLRKQGLLPAAQA